MSYGLKISLPGYDVKTATPEQCVVHSSYPPFKSKINQPNPHFGTLEVAFTSGITQNVTHTVYSIPHNYTYIPFTFPFITISGGTIGSTINGLGFTGIGATLAIYAYADINNFYVTVYDNNNWINNTARLSVTYYIFCDEVT
jgi:hypothetical protein